MFAAETVRLPAMERVDGRAADRACSTCGGGYMKRPYRPRIRRGALTIWHTKPAVILCCYVFLLLAGSTSSPLRRGAGIAPGHSEVTLLVSWVVALWLVWRVWRRGQISRWLLIIFVSGSGCVNAAFHIRGDRAALLLLVIYAGQIALMLSPAISRHVTAQTAAQDRHGDNSART